MKLPLRFAMTITRVDFRRLLPAAVDHVAFVEEDRAYTYTESGRGWRIGFEPLPPLRLGLIRLDRHQVDFAFTGYSAQAVEDFMARFEMYFRRAGG